MNELIKHADFKTMAKGVQSYLNKTQNKTLRHATLGGLAAVVGTAALMPIDTISDVQKQWRNTKGEPELQSASKSFIATAKEIYKPKIRKDSEGGIRPFYAGVGGKLLKTVPQQAIMFGAMPYIGKSLGLKS